PLPRLPLRLPAPLTALPLIHLRGRSSHCGPPARAPLHPRRLAPSPVQNQGRTPLRGARYAPVVCAPGSRRSAAMARSHPAAARACLRGSSGRCHAACKQRTRRASGLTVRCIRETTEEENDGGGDRGRPFDREGIASGNGVVKASSPKFFHLAARLQREISTPPRAR